MPTAAGHTDGHSSTACAQAGLYVHALDLVVEELGIADQIVIRTDGFLVLTKPGSNFPSVRAGEDLRFQVERARRGFELLEAAAQGLPPYSEISDDPMGAVIVAETEYTDSCLTFCDRATKCWEDAAACGDPAILGEDTRRFLGEINLHRACRDARGRQTSHRR